MSRRSIRICLYIFLAGCVSPVPCGPGTVSVSDACVSDDAAESCLRTFYADIDRDGHGDPRNVMSACAGPEGYVESSDDCDDATDDRSPDVAETCDGFDEDCDTEIDETFDCPRNATIECTTTCGTTGMTTCGTDCVMPALCTPPLEMCDGADDDCDGLTDEGTLAVGSRQDLGDTASGSAGAVLVPTGAGFAVFWEDTGGDLVGRRLTTDASPVGAVVSVTSSPFDSFDAAWSGSQLLVAFVHEGDEPEHASLVRYEDDLTAPFSTTVPVTDARAPIHVVAGGSAAIVALDSEEGSGFHIGTVAVRVAFPGLSGPMSATLGDFPRDMILNASRSEAYLLSSDLPAPFDARRIGLTGAVSAGSLFHRLPTIDATEPAALGLGGASGDRLLVVQAGRSVGAAGGIEASLGAIAGDGSHDVLVAGAVLLDGLDTTEPVIDLAITHALDRFLVAAIVRDGVGVHWIVLEVLERADGSGLVVHRYDVEASTDADHVSIAARDDGGIFTVGATDGGAVRVYRLGCL